MVRLPKLPRGVYKVRATFLGNAVAREGPLEDPDPEGRRARRGRRGRLCLRGSNVPDGSDGRGGCFPGTSNTGPKAPASSMATYTGSCTINTANVVIDSKVVNCRTIVVAGGGAGFVLKNSYLNGGIVQSGGAAAFTVQDSFIDSGIQYPACSDGSCPAGKYACGDTGNATTDCGVTGSNFTILRTEIINSNRAAYCESSCLIQDSYFHGTNLWPDASNLAHASSVREEQGLTLRHNSLHCSYTGPFVNGEIGCSADLTGYPDFAPIKNNTVDGNLFVASSGSGVLRLRRRHQREAVLRRPDERHQPEVHQQRVPARHQQQVRLLRAGDQLQQERRRQRLVRQRVGQRDVRGGGELRTSPGRLVEELALASVSKPQKAVLGVPSPGGFETGQSALLNHRAATRWLRRLRSNRLETSGSGDWHRSQPRVAGFRDGRRAPSSTTGGARPPHRGAPSSTTGELRRERPPQPPVTGG